LLNLRKLLGTTQKRTDASSAFQNPRRGHPGPLCSVTEYIEIFYGWKEAGSVGYLSPLHLSAGSTRKDWQHSPLVALLTIYLMAQSYKKTIFVARVSDDPSQLFLSRDSQSSKTKLEISLEFLVFFCKPETLLSENHSN
jgi:hypothetical protein